MKAQYLVLLIIPFTLLSCTRVKKEFWPNGNIRTEISMKGGTYNGPSKWFFEDGTLQMECVYKDDKLNGTMVRYYGTGTKKEQITYKDNKPEGDSIILGWQRKAHCEKQLPRQSARWPIPGILRRGFNKNRRRLTQ